MTTTEKKQYSVGGVMLDRPFKIRRLGHFGFNSDRMEESVKFYRDLLGFYESDVLDFKRIPGLEDKLSHIEDGRGSFSPTAATTMLLCSFPET